MGPAFVGRLRTCEAGFGGRVWSLIYWLRTDEVQTLTLRYNARCRVGMLAGSVFFKIEFLAASPAGDPDPLPLPVEVSRAEGGPWPGGTWRCFCGI